MRLTKKLETSQTFIKYLEKEIIETNTISSEIIKNHIIGESETIGKVFCQIKQIAPSDKTVLIQGETGTGKELFAKELHAKSKRSDKPFVVVNCATLPRDLLESELFGYEEGAFTGAKKKGKPGKFELAKGGTIFLDEIGEIPFTIQSKFLRVIQEKEFFRIGGNKNISVDVRIITATNRDLRKMVEESVFREDLFYRINVVPIKIPPLRARKEDIPHLTKYFLKIYSTKRIRVSDIVFNIFYSYNWPGNVRELENAIQHALVMLEDDIDIILPRHLPEHISSSEIKEERELLSINRLVGLDQLKEELEKKAIKEALEISKTKTEAIKLLNISRRSFYQKLKKYGQQ